MSVNIAKINTMKRGDKESVKEIYIISRGKKKSSKWIKKYKNHNLASKVVVQNITKKMSKNHMKKGMRQSLGLCLIRRTRDI